MDRRRFLHLCGGILAAAPGAARAQAPADFRLGPFLPSPAVSLYVIGDGKPCRVAIKTTKRERPEADRVLIRVFDPDEKPIVWKYADGIPENAMGDGTSPGLPEAQLTLERAGVYQIRVGAGQSNTAVTVEMERPLEYGVSFQNGEFKPWEGMDRVRFVYVPPRAEELTVTGGPLAIVDEAGRDLYRTRERASDPATIPVAKTEVVWQITLGTAPNAGFRAAGFPVILCSSEGAARTIRASAEVLPDGTVVAHRFQRRIAELLPGLLDPKNVGRSEELLTPLISRKDAWLRDPLRNVALLNSYAMMPSVQESLKIQNVDPKSHWGGSLSGAPGGAPKARWDRWKSVPGLWAGASDNNGADAENLALAALLDAPFNPYFGRKELIFRAAAAALRDLMLLGEDEIWRGVGADLDPYPGMMAFPSAQKTFPVFAVAAPHLPAEIRAVWTEGLRHIVDRTFTDSLVSARNQSSHYLVAYHDFATGSGDPRARRQAAIFAARFAAGMKPAASQEVGYHEEATGPDATYIGMTHWHEAVYWRASRDPKILDSIRKSYRFYNHTVAPELDGTLLGGFNFAHRTGGGFHEEQWGGAKGILDDVLPEVGVWAPDPAGPDADERRRKAAETIGKWLDELPVNRHSNIDNPRYYHYAAKPARSGYRLPAREPEAFLRDVGGEMVATKQRHYYAVVYVGKPAAGDHYIRGRADFRTPLADDAENRGGQINVRKITPFLGGGLTLFQMPVYGCGILAANWSPVTHHGLVATDAEGRRWWEDYYATQYRLDEGASTLTVTGKIEGQPIAYTRVYRFDPVHIEMTLRLEATGDVTLASLVENVPVPFGPVKKRGAAFAPVSGEADQVRVLDREGAGFAWQLDRPRAVRLQPDGPKNRNLQIGRFEITLPSALKKSERFEMNCRLLPLKRSEPT